MRAVVVIILTMPSAMLVVTVVKLSKKRSSLFIARLIV